MSSLNWELLDHIAAKIETRVRSPWIELQRTFYQQSDTIKTVKDLQHAFQHFHVSLSNSEARHLFKHFHNQNGTFSFQQFSQALYPKPRYEKIKDGRPVDGTKIFQTYSDSQGLEAQQPTKEEINQLFLNEYLRANPFDPSSASSLSSSSLSSSSSSSSSSFGLSTRPVSAGEIALSNPRLGETLGPRGTTCYWKHHQQQRLQSETRRRRARCDARSERHQKGSLKIKYPLDTTTAQNSHTFSRHQYQQFNSAAPSQVVYPSFTPYPQAELSGGPKFEYASFPVYPEVDRRHNISRITNRTGAPVVRKSFKR